MYLCQELTGLSLPQIGQAVGGRDHTTVMYAGRKIRQPMADDGAVRDQIAALTNTIQTPTDAVMPAAIAKRSPNATRVEAVPRLAAQRAFDHAPRIPELRERLSCGGVQTSTWRRHESC
jgi:hypothetical protein